MSIAAAISDVDIRVTAKRVDASQPRNDGDGTRTIAKEHWNYEVTVENKSFKPLNALEVRYAIFYKTEQLGSKEPAKQERQTGTFSISGLAPHERKNFTTNSVELNKSHLTGNWYYSGGQRIHAEDTLVGVWVRVYQSGEQIGEYANPTTLAKEQWQ
jgi:hypothetical protein